jgi:hypothetical protein
MKNIHEKMFHGLKILYNSKLIKLKLNNNQISWFTSNVQNILNSTTTKKKRFRNFELNFQQNFNLQYFNFQCFNA